MDYYDNEENVEQYIRMATGYDGEMLIDALRKYLPDGSKLLELGSGPGKDLLLLSEHYQATGSDSSAIFVERLRKLNPGIKVRQLDAIMMNTDERYDGIYSNKVLIHLSRDELPGSFERQARVLKTGGIALHSFWYGDGEVEHQGLRFVYYREDSLRALIGRGYEILECNRYTEIEPDDSMYMVLRKR